MALAQPKAFGKRCRRADALDSACNNEDEDEEAGEYGCQASPHSSLHDGGAMGLIPTDVASPGFVRGVTCSVIFVQRMTTLHTDEDGDSMGTGFHYTHETLYSLLRVLNLKMRTSKAVVAATFEYVESMFSKTLSRSVNRSWAWTARQDGTYMLSIPREDFIQLVMDQARKQCTLHQDDLKIGASLREGERCVVVLLCGTSGCGKSTLASLLGQNLGISTVVSTDSIRNMLKGFTTKAQDPVLFSSTYDVGEAMATMGPDFVGLSEKKRVIKGYKAQCEPILRQLDRLLTAWAARNESAVVEGVHLSLKMVVRLMVTHPCIVPFLVYIKKEHKHVERMAVRAKYMALDPAKNKYVKYISNIRLIQDYLVLSADKLRIPKVENSKLDSSVDLIHNTVLAVLRRMRKGDVMFDQATRTARAVMAEYDAALTQQQKLQREMKLLREQLRTLVADGGPSIEALKGESQEAFVLGNQGKVASKHLRNPSDTSLSGVSVMRMATADASRPTTGGAWEPADASFNRDSAMADSWRQSLGNLGAWDTSDASQTGASFFEFPRRSTGNLSCNTEPMTNVDAVQCISGPLSRRTSLGLAEACGSRLAARSPQGHSGSGSDGASPFLVGVAHVRVGVDGRPLSSESLSATSACADDSDTQTPRRRRQRRSTAHPSPSQLTPTYSARADALEKLGLSPPLNPHLAMLAGSQSTPASGAAGHCARTDAPAHRLKPPRPESRSPHQAASSPTRSTVPALQPLRTAPRRATLSSSPRGPAHAHDTPSGLQQPPQQQRTEPERSHDLPGAQDRALLDSAARSAVPKAAIQAAVQAAASGAMDEDAMRAAESLKLAAASRRLSADNEVECELRSAAERASSIASCAAHQLLGRQSSAQMMSASAQSADLEAWGNNHLTPSTSDAPPSSFPLRDGCSTTSHVDVPLAGVAPASRNSCATEHERGPAAASAQPAAHTTRGRLDRGDMAASYAASRACADMARERSAADEAVLASEASVESHHTLAPPSQPLESVWLQQPFAGGALGQWPQASVFSAPHLATYSSDDATTTAEPHNSDYEDVSDDEFAAQMVTEVGSLSDSTDLEDDEVVHMLWAKLCARYGAFHSVAEPRRTALLCAALLDYINQHTKSPSPRPARPSRHTVDGLLRRKASVHEALSSLAGQLSFSSHPATLALEDGSGGRRPSTAPPSLLTRQGWTQHTLQTARSDSALLSATRRPDDGSAQYPAHRDRPPSRNIDALDLALKAPDARTTPDSVALSSPSATADSRSHSTANHVSITQDTSPSRAPAEAQSDPGEAPAPAPPLAADAGKQAFAALRSVSMPPTMAASSARALDRASLSMGAWGRSGVPGQSPEASHRPSRAMTRRLLPGRRLLPSLQNSLSALRRTMRRAAWTQEDSAEVTTAIGQMEMLVARLASRRGSLFLNRMSAGDAASK